MPGRLEIHHINVNNGDSTLILLKNQYNEIIGKTALIDGGMTKFDSHLGIYLPNPSAMGNYKTIDFLILTHFHADHFAGFKDLWRKGNYKIRQYIDPGGYSLKYSQSTINDLRILAAKQEALFELGKTKKVPVIKTTIQEEMQPKGNYSIKHINSSYLSSLKTGITQNCELKRVPEFNDISRRLGSHISLGDIDDVEVKLTLVAGAGFSLDAHGKIVDKELPGNNSPNNYTLAFILEYGTFRYFLGGDMSGESDEITEYNDQEIDLINYLMNTKFKEPVFPYNTKEQSFGHVCGIKINHHGSRHSNYDDFLYWMTPATCVTSVGNQPMWGLPHPDVIKRIYEFAQPLTLWNDTQSRFTPPRIKVYNRGAYFTNLLDFLPNKVFLNDT